MSKVEEARRRRDNKLRQTRRKQSLSILLVMTALSLVVATAYFVINSDLWLIKSISVTGNKNVSAQKVSRLAGVGKRTNLIRISPGSIVEKLKTNPWISDATVSRYLPSTLSIDIVERKPFACVKQGGRIFIMDDRGYVVSAPKKMMKEAVPVIDGVKLKSVEVGSRAKSRLLPQVLNSLRKLEPSIRSKVIWVSVPTLDSLAFHTIEDVEIIFGSAEEAAKKNYVIKKILADSDDRVIHINVTVPDNPVVRKLNS